MYFGSFSVLFASHLLYVVFLIRELYSCLAFSDSKSKNVKTSRVHVRAVIWKCSSKSSQGCFFCVVTSGPTNSVCLLL